MTTTIPSRLSDGELVAEVARLAGCEREASASLVAHLAELYGRRLHERAGYASLFTYCTSVLRLSEHEAYDRMRAAKVARRYPVVLGLLASGRVNLTTVRLLAPHLTRKNHEELLAAACGKRKRQVQELLAAWFPQPVRHAIPSGDPAQIVGRALQVLVEDLVRRKFAVGRRPRASKGQPDESRNIPAEVQRTVFIRDRGRCAFIGTHGRRCGERAFVEFHHLIPYAAGGRTTVENLALRCHAHNAYEAEVFYGPIAAARVTDDAFRSGTTGEGRPRTRSQGTASARAQQSMVWTSA